MGKNYVQRFRKKWLEDSRYRNWLRPSENDDTKSYCKFCQVTLLAKLYDIEKHRVTLKHQNAEKHFPTDILELEYQNDFEIENQPIIYDNVENQNYSESPPDSIPGYKKVVTHSKREETKITEFLNNYCTLSVWDHLPLLTAEERTQSLQPLLTKGWSLVDGKDAIQKKFMFKDFSQAFGYMTRIGLASEKHDHHPEWSNVYNSVSILWFTHASGGLTINDTKMAILCDKIYKDYNN